MPKQGNFSTMSCTFECRVGQTESGQFRLHRSLLPPEESACPLILLKLFTFCRFSVGAVKYATSGSYDLHRFRRREDLTKLEWRASCGRTVCEFNRTRRKCNTFHPTVAERVEACGTLSVLTKERTRTKSRRNYVIYVNPIYVIVQKVGDRRSTTRCTL